MKELSTIARKSLASIKKRVGEGSGALNDFLYVRKNKDIKFHIPDRSFEKQVWVDEAYNDDVCDSVLYAVRAMQKNKHDETNNIIDATAVDVTPSKEKLCLTEGK